MQVSLVRITSFNLIFQVICSHEFIQYTSCEFFVKTDKLEYRAVIKLIVLDGLVLRESAKIYKNLQSSSLFISTIKNWSAKFKCGCTSLENERRPKTASTREVIEKVHDTVLGSPSNRWKLLVQRQRK